MRQDGVGYSRPLWPLPLPFVFVVNLSGMYIMDHMVVMAGRTNRRLNVKCGYPRPLWSLLITILYHLNHHAAA